MKKIKLYLTKGLPASGKSTWAKEMQLKDPSIVRVNKDSLREMLHNNKWTKGNEKEVMETRDMIVGTALAHGRSVIVDDTNFHHSHEEKMKEIASHYENVEIIIKDFTDVELDVCIARDKERSNSVGKKVIMRMYNQYLRKKHEKPLNPVVYSDSLPYCVIFDLDGTLAHITDRSPYDGKSCGSDLVNESIRWIAKIIYNYTQEILDSTHVIVLSGRNGDSRKETEQWLSDHGITYDELFMRKEGDARKDAIVKKELFDEHIKDRYNVLFIVDDRNQVVDLWRSMGITCLQCNYGDF